MIRPDKYAGYEFSGFRLDATHRQLWSANGQLITLTSRVFDTLLYFVEHHGELLDKTTLVHALWPDTVVEENNLNQAISALRGALEEKPGEHRFIVTDPGRGYWFVADIKTLGAATQLEPEKVVIVSPPPLPNSVAVLPFDNFSPSPDDDYFVAGIYEEILNQLTNLKSLNVIARTTMRRYADTDKSIREIASELNVETVMEGSVRYAADRVRVTTQLIDPLTGAHLWSEAYDRELKDIFAIQSDIAMNVANALKAEFSLTERARIERVPTDSPEAYTLYLSAQALNSRQTRDGIALGLEKINRALELDPEFALGWVMKSVLHNHAQPFFPERVNEERAAAERAVRRAIELDSNRAVAHAPLAFNLASRGEWQRAEAEFKQARALGMSVGEIANYEVGFRSAVGHIERAHEMSLTWQARDPLNSGASFLLLVQHDILGETRAALAEYERGKELFDDWPAGYFNAFVTLLGSGEHERAKELARSELREPVVAAIVEHFDTPEAALAELRTLYTDDAYADPISRLAIAVLAAYFDDKQLALNALADSIDAFAINALMLWRPLFREMRQQAGFKNFMRDKGFVAYWQGYGWPDLCKPVRTGDFECR
jgi:TolB-like protein